MKQKNRKNILITLGILIGLLCLVGIGYAYFAANMGSDAETNVNVTSKTSDSLTFTQGTDLSLTATQQNFNPDDLTNVTGTTKGSAKLVANSGNNTASATYQVYFRISQNGYTYTQNESTPELILTIKDPDNNNVTSIEGLTYVTSNGISGFDVTNKTGFYNVSLNHAISTSSSTTGTTQEWNVTLTYINLNADQQANAGKTFSSKLVLHAKPYSASIPTGTTATALKTLVDAGTEPYGIVNQNGYRYSGEYYDVDNWICFGTTETTCPENNLYRIIGVFNLDGVYKYKLIKGDFATTADAGTPYSTVAKDITYPGYTKQSTINRYQWDSANKNTWSIASLNTLLNNTYLTNLGTTWANKIATSTYYVNGYNTSSANSATFYTAESTGTTWSGKVGLMYVSDYGYGATSNYWTMVLSSYNNAAYLHDWLFNGGYYEWTMSPFSSNSYNVFRLNYIGTVDGANAFNGFAFRPVFYLNSDVAISGGTGTYTNPYTISVS